MECNCTVCNCARDTRYSSIVQATNLALARSVCQSTAGSSLLRYRGPEGLPVSGKLCEPTPIDLYRPLDRGRIHHPQSRKVPTSMSGSMWRHAGHAIRLELGDMAGYPLELTLHMNIALKSCRVSSRVPKSRLVCKSVSSTPHHV